jgi:hypothetical protein
VVTPTQPLSRSPAVVDAACLLLMLLMVSGRCTTCSELTSPVLLLLCRSPITSLQLGGYAVAFLGVCWYNYQKIQQMKAAHMQRQTQQALAEISKQEAKPLLAEQPKQ